MNLRNLAIWGVIVVVLIGVYSVVSQGGRGGGAASEISYSQLLRRIDSGEVRTAIFHGPVIEARTSDGKTITSTTPNNPDDLVKRLESRGADIQFKAPGGLSLVGILVNMLPILLLIGVWIFFMRQMQGGAKGAMGFGKSKARLLTENKNRITFEEVAGVDEAKASRPTSFSMTPMWSPPSPAPPPASSSTMASAAMPARASSCTRRFSTRWRRASPPMPRRSSWA